MFSAIVLLAKTPTMLLSRRQVGKILTLAKIYESQHSLLCTGNIKKRTTILSVKKSNTESVNVINTSSGLQEPSSISGSLTTQQAQELALRLTSDERQCLVKALQEFESKLIKDEYEGQLAAHRWRSKFGRPSKVPKLGDVDPTGSYCKVPEDWLREKYASTVPTPSPNDLFHLSVANSIPFVGFGFLDNFIMICAGDYIDQVLGTYIYLSTMAAAALGNTFSDVIGIGSAFYVERFAERIGFKPPNLTPIQLDMPISRRASNMGRVLGITVGCLLGMIPLLFMNNTPKPTPKGLGPKDPSKEPGKDVAKDIQPLVDLRNDPIIESKDQLIVNVK